jgi:[phosphatase 2A protein]-leucine-carboxy methyltransferase
MSAPSIPNLLSLRGSRGGSRGRGRGRGAGYGNQSPKLSHDATIQGTDTDAAVSRLSAVDLGYLEDPFARYFVQTPGLPARRLPIINRGEPVHVIDCLLVPTVASAEVIETGTYTRTTALDRLVFAFLKEADHEDGGGVKRQIISLGAGTDTRCFRLLSRPETARLLYHEVDFRSTSAKKFGTVHNNALLKSVLRSPMMDDDGTWSSLSPALDNECEYRCHGLDLRELLRPESEGESPKSLGGLNPDLPTLLISECCLCYLETEEARGVIKYFTDRIKNLAIVIYEPIKPDDPFGRQMVSNLAARGIRMPTLDSYNRSRDQEARLRDAGFDMAKSMSVEDIWRHWVPPDEKERVDELEGLDEVEEWNLLAGHYVVAWGWRGNGFDKISAL